MIDEIKNHAAALVKISRANDFFKKALKDALDIGVSPEAIIDLLDSPETRITAAVMRHTLESEVMVREIETKIEEDSTDVDHP